MSSIAVTQKQIPSPATVPAHHKAAWVLSALILAAIYGGSPNFRFSDTLEDTPFGGDFLQEWIGGYLVQNGELSRSFEPSYIQSLQHDATLVGFHWDESKYFPIVYPPFYYLLVSPLSYLPLTAAAWVWATCLVMCHVTGIRLLSRAVRLDCRPSHRLDGLLPWLLPFSLLFVPVVHGLTSSQKSSVCLGILAGTYWLLATKRPTRAGILFGCLAFKPQLMVIIAICMAFKKQWQFILGATTTVSLLCFMSILFGWEVCIRYVQFASGALHYIETPGYDQTKSHCILGFFTLLLDGRASGLTLGLTLIATLGIVFLLIKLLTGKLQPTSPLFKLQFSGLVLATVLQSPHLLTYDLVLLMVPFCLITGVLFNHRLMLQQHHPHRLQWGLLVLFLATGVSHFIAAATHVQITVILMAILLAQLSAIALDSESE